MTTYKISIHNTDIKTLIRIAMFTNTKDTEILIDKDYHNNEELNTNLFHPLLWSLEVNLLIDELQRNTSYHTNNARTIIDALHMAFDNSDLTSLENIEKFKSYYYGNLHDKDTNE